MSVYSYTGASVITEVRFRYANDRPPEALLIARGGVGADQLATIKHTLENSGLQCVPAFAEEREVLQVAGFENAGQLNDLLLKNRFTEGDPQITAEEGDNPKRSFKSWLRRSSLQGAGWLNLIGDVGLLVSGVRNKNPYHTVGGALYTGGATAAALYGDVKPERQVDAALDRTAEVLKGQAVDVPQDSSLYNATQQSQNQLHGIQGFLHQHAAQTMLGFYTAGAATMLLGGLNMRDAQGRRNPFDIAYGANSLTLKAASLALPEKPKTEKGEKEEEPHGLGHRIAHWLIDEPMRLFGIGSFASDSFLAGRNILQQRRNPKGGIDYFMWTTTGTYLLADVLAALSSKNPSNADGKFSIDQQRRIEAMAAETIARQPEASRETLAEEVATVISRQAEMHGNVDKISRSISEQVKHMAKNPWAQRVAAEPVAAAEQSPR